MEESNFNFSGEKMSLSKEKNMPEGGFAEANRLKAELEAANQRIRELEERVRELENLLEVDERTGLLNERGWQRHLFERVSKAVRSKDSFAVLAIDLDNLKKINDNFGHEVGDKWIELYGKIMREGLRPEDVKAHLHGDEYVALLTGVFNEKDVVSIVERLRSKLEEEVQRLVDGDLREAARQFGLGASIGFALKFWEEEEISVLSGAGSSEDRRDKLAELLNPILRMADENMYEDKRRRKVTR